MLGEVLVLDLLVQKQSTVPKEPPQRSLVTGLSPSRPQRSLISPLLGGPGYLYLAP